MCCDVMAAGDYSPVDIQSTASPANSGLGYSRHYAQRIRDLGKTSKESWIKRLWNHMFGANSVGSKKSNVKTEDTVLGNNFNSKSTDDVADDHQEFPSEVSSHGQVTESNELKTHRQVSNSDKHDAAVPAVQRQARSSHDLSGRNIPHQLINSPYLPPKEKVVYYRPVLTAKPAVNARDGVTAARLRFQRLSQSSTALHSDGNTDGSDDQRKLSRVKRQIKRDLAVIQMEKQAKAVADRAIVNLKIFTCSAPYPVDVFVRLNLRERGWVEKFGPRMLSSALLSRNTDKTLQCVTDEEYAAICLQTIPKPWEESNGYYAALSKFVSRSPAKFIWAGKSINDVVLKSDVIVNHFPKAKYFSSKVLLTNSLRELPWQNNTDAMTFFPRCYVLNDSEKADFFDDFLLTACTSLLKLVVKMMPESTADAEQDESTEEDLDSAAAVELHADDNLQHVHTDDSELSTEPQSPTTADITTDDAETADDSGYCFEDDVAHMADYDDQDYVPAYKTDIQKVVPDLDSAVTRKIGGVVPQTAVEHASQYCMRYIRSRLHEDLDKHRKPFSQSHCDQLLSWCYQALHDGATIDVDANKVSEYQRILQRMRSFWPQYDIDGVHNMWIVKPGDKSKGVGISFCDNMEEIQKYISNPATQDYIIQKYIERPMLIYNCKFDIRQWFLVTDWLPLTIWFYKDSYLRICSQEFNLDCFHESIHLSNVAVQENYINGKRSEKIPENNFMTSDQLKEYLCETGVESKWDDVIYPGMKATVINTMIATQEHSESRKNAFELYGADFMIDENYGAWLLEVNSSPGMLPSSIEKTKLCAAVISDTIKVVLDYRANSSCDTGRFELIYRGTTNPNTKGCDTKFVVAGQRINKIDLQRYIAIDRKAMRLQEQSADTKDKPAQEPTSEASVDSVSNKVSLVQLSEASSSQNEAVDCESVDAPPRSDVSNTATEPGRHVTMQQPSTMTAMNAVSQDRSTNTSNKQYKGLRQSTVQIYNGR